MPKLTPKALELLARVEARQNARREQILKDQQHLAALARRQQAEDNEHKYGGGSTLHEDNPLDIGKTQDRYTSILLSLPNGKCTTRGGTYRYHKYGDGRRGFRQKQET